MAVQLSATITSRYIRFIPTINGTPIARTLTMRNADGQIGILRMKPGEFILARRDRLGVRFETHAGLAPAGSIEALVSFEVSSS
jgi:hypothetical protein